MASSGLCASSRDSLISISFIRKFESAPESVPSSIFIPSSSSWNIWWESVKGCSFRSKTLVLTVRWWRTCDHTDRPCNYEFCHKLNQRFETHHIKTTTQRLKQSVVCFVNECRLAFWILLFFLQKRDVLELFLSIASSIQNHLLKKEQKGCIIKTKVFICIAVDLKEWTFTIFTENVSDFTLCNCNL